MGPPKRKGGPAKKGKKVGKNTSNILKPQVTEKMAENFDRSEVPERKKKRRATPVEEEIERIGGGKNLGRKSKHSEPSVVTRQQTQTADFEEDGNYVHLESEGMHTEFLNETGGDTCSESEHEEGGENEDSTNNNATVAKKSGKSRSQPGREGSVDSVQEVQGRIQNNRRSTSRSRSISRDFDRDQRGYDPEEGTSRRGSGSKRQPTPHQSDDDDFNAPRDYHDKGLERTPPPRKSKRQDEIDCLKAEIESVNLLANQVRYRTGQLFNMTVTALQEVRTYI